MYPTLRFGYTGAAVTQLQSLLNQIQSALGSVIADGVFGQQTRLRVIDFQGKRGLTADGIVGAQTWASLLGVKGGAGNGAPAGTPSAGTPAAKNGAATPDSPVTPQPATPTVPGDLSVRRKQVLESIVPGVVPSAYPDAKFNKMTGGLDLSSPSLPKGFTTCGSLPAYVARTLGGRGMIQSGGLNGLRDGAKKHNAWIVADRSQLPRPGDLYGLCTGPGPDTLIVHVGVIVDASGEIWQTADAGQGQLPQQRAAYVSRRYDSMGGTLSGEVTQGSNRPPRLVAGWVDIDAYPF